MAEAKELSALALKGALSVQHQQRLLALLDQEPHVVYEIGVTPNQVCMFFFYFFSLIDSHIPVD